LEPIVLKKLGVCPGSIDFAERLTAEVLFLNYVCHGVHFENHVPVFEHDFAVAEFFSPLQTVSSHG
jgi:hypothetical protein